MKIDSLPFYIQYCKTPNNPLGFPNSMAFACQFNPEIGALIQIPKKKIIKTLEKVYRTSSMLGTPLSDDPFGKPCADDFIKFIKKFKKTNHSNVLEIGAGVGYLVRRFLDLGWKVTGVEPGKGYIPYWKKYDVNIINDFFPNPHTLGPYNLIYSYCVLEHILHPVEFLMQIKNKLTQGGIAILAVPDCSDEIIDGDPAILVHEHFTYFNRETLISVLWHAGLKAKVFKSGYSRLLYVVAEIRENNINKEKRTDIALLKNYPQRTKNFLIQMRQKFRQLAKSGSLGIYCPGRALSVLDFDLPVRFFDDDMRLKGKYLPPFRSPIEGPDSLLQQPVDIIVVMSRTFGDRIRNNLKKRGYNGIIFTVNELMVTT